MNSACVRRVRIALMALVCYAGSLDAASLAGAEPHVEEWMNTWMSIERQSGGVLHLTRFKEPIYILTAPITWEPDQDNSDYPTVTVPVGFVTDFASVPPIFYSILRADGEYTHPAIVHDYLYWSQEVTQKKADEILRIALKEFDIGIIKTALIYLAVRSPFGQAAWSENKKAKQDGEKRVLKKFPTKPTVSWQDWKQKEGVFE